MAQTNGTAATAVTSQLNQECVVCMQSVHPADVTRLSCDDLYCRLCLNELFDNAAHDESMFPPACAHGPIELEVVRSSLLRSVSEAFESKSAEFSTRDRVYCYEAACSTWIPPRNVQGKNATCPRCSRLTCAFCKARIHDDECPDDPAIRSLMATAEREGYRQCPRCRRMIERTMGCNHIM